jgi:ATP-dependent protease ClpP protease subunit
MLEKIIVSFSVVLCTISAQLLGNAQAAEIKLDQNAILIDGDLKDGDSDTLAVLLARYLEKICHRDIECELSHKPPFWVEINSTGGSVAEGFALAMLIEKEALPVIIKQTCQSACFFVLACATENRVAGGATAGIHGVHSIRKTAVSHRAIELVSARLFARCGVPKNLAEKIPTRGPRMKDMYWLSPEDLRLIGSSEWRG